MSFPVLANFIGISVRFPTSASNGPWVIISPSFMLGIITLMFRVTLLASTPLDCCPAVNFGVAVTGSINSPAIGNSSPGPSIASHDWNISSTSNPDTLSGVTIEVHLTASLLLPGLCGVNVAEDTDIFASTPPVTAPPRLCLTCTDKDSISSIPPEPLASRTSSGVNII